MYIYIICIIIYVKNYRLPGPGCGLPLSPRCQAAMGSDPVFPFLKATRKTQDLFSARVLWLNMSGKQSKMAQAGWRGSRTFQRPSNSHPPVHHSGLLFCTTLKTLSLREVCSGSRGQRTQQPAPCIVGSQYTLVE